MAEILLQLLTSLHTRHLSCGCAHPAHRSHSACARADRDQRSLSRSTSTQQSTRTIKLAAPSNDTTTRTCDLHADAPHLPALRSRERPITHPLEGAPGLLASPHTRRLRCPVSAGSTITLPAPSITHTTPIYKQCHLAPWKLHVHYPAPHSSATPRLGAQRALDGAASARLPSRRPTAVVTHTHAETRRARPSLSRVSPEHPRVGTKGTRSGSRYAHGSGGRGAHALGCATTAVRTTCGMPLISAICEADHPLVPPGVVMSCWIMVPGEKLEGEREPRPLPRESRQMPDRRPMRSRFESLADTRAMSSSAP